MNTGEVLRRTVFNLLDASKGGKLQKLKEVNKREIVEGVTEEYMERRLNTLRFTANIRNGKNSKISRL